MQVKVLGQTTRLVLTRVMLALVVGLAVAGCGMPGRADPDSVTVGLSFVPNIQFAPFYVADAKGYYKDAGLKVELRHHGAGEDQFGALVAGQEDMMFAGGDEVLQAASRDVAIVYVAEVFTQYPVGLVVPASSPIQSVADLKGHTVGIPGAYGATYIGLLALLQSAGLTEQDVDVQSIGFTQVPALLSNRVDAVMGYINNEPIQLQKAGMEVRTFPVSAAKPLISNGLAAMQKELDTHPDRVKAIVEATLRGAAYTREHPEEAVTISAKYVPGLAESDKAADALAVLKATIPILQQTGKAGASDPNDWQSMADFLHANGQLTKPVDVSKVFSNAYLP